MEVSGVNWREIVEWMVGRLASSFSSILNGPMPTLPIGKAIRHMASVCFF